MITLLYNFFKFMLVKRLLGFGRTIARLFHFQICLIYVLVQGNNRKLMIINYPLKTWACKSLKGVLRGL